LVKITGQKVETKFLSRRAYGKKPEFLETQRKILYDKISIPFGLYETHAMVKIKI
jgi:hypothetical protein